MTASEYPATSTLFDLSGMVAVVTGGTGSLGRAMAHGLADAGARVGVLGRRSDRAGEIVKEITANGGKALPLVADVLDPAELEAARDAILDRWGHINILVNAAGGNIPEATVTEDRSFFDLEPDALRRVVDLNLLGTLLPCRVFGEAMARTQGASIVNISSMAANRALTRVVAYGAAKAGVESVTRWLAVEFARTYGSNFRVNAVAPGFFVGEQNRALLLDADGTPTERGAKIIERTPVGRLGEPEDLIGPVVWLSSPAAVFVTGVVVPVDGGFSAFSGV
jgi:NAD(P)-dependent dehydrogenase (short-subunit alcohol dehydrogenase family)